MLSSDIIMTKGTGFFRRIGDIYAAAGKESAQTDGDEFNGLSMFADHQNGDRFALRHQAIPTRLRNSNKFRPSAISPCVLIS